MQRVLRYCLIRGGVGLCLIASSIAIARSDECVLLKQSKGIPAIRYGPDTPKSGRTVIEKSGHYCLAEDFNVDGKYWPLTPEGPKLFSDDDRILVLDADGISIDFKGHLVTSDAGLHFGIYSPQFLSPIDTLDTPLRAPIRKNIFLRNGVLKLSRSGMALVIAGFVPNRISAIKLVTEKDVNIYKLDKDNKLREARVAYENESLIKIVKDGSAAYPLRNLQIENMRIQSKDYPVELQGASTVIKDSVIETDSGTALWLYGPNAVIENNTIIVHCIETKPSYQSGVSYCNDQDAPIRLMHGDGALIRNNRFILANNAHKRVISLFETGPFTFENNTIVGLDNLNQTAQAFTGKLDMKASNNKIDNSVWSKVKSWFGYYSH
jgi:Right handed beta helix region